MVAKTSELVTDAVLRTTQFKASMRDLATYTQNYTDNLSKGFEKLQKVIAGGLVAKQTLSFLTDAFNSVDDLVDASRRLGVSAESFQFLEFAAKRSGTSIEELESSFQKFNLNLARLGSNKEAVATLQSLGLSVAALQGMASDDAAFTFLNALKDLPSSVQRDIGTQFFGKNFFRMLELANSDLTKFKQAFADFGGPLQITGKNFDELGDKVDDLSGSWVKFKRSLVVDYSGAITVALDQTTNSLAAATKYVERVIAAYGALSKGQAFATPASEKLPFQAATQMTPEDAGRFVLMKNTEAWKENNTAVLSSTEISKEASKKAMLNYTGITAAVNAAVGNIKVLGNGFDFLIKATTEAAKGLKALKFGDFKAALGLTAGDGEQYLQDVLPALTQYRSRDFDYFAKELRDALQGGLTDESVIGKFMANLGAIAETSWQNLKPGETNSGILAAYDLLKKTRDSYNTRKVDDTAAKPMVTVKLEYDQEGIIKAVIGSNTFESVAGNVVGNVAAKEALATQSNSGGGGW